MKYDFNEVIDRTDTDSLTQDGWKEYMFAAHKLALPAPPEDGFINLWVADMAFATPQPVIDGIKARLDKKILGYTAINDQVYYDIFGAWCDRQYGYRFRNEDIVLSPGVIPALGRLVSLLSEPDDSVMIMTPSYSAFKEAASICDRRVVCLPLDKTGDGWICNLSKMYEMLGDDNLKIKMLFLCNPHNPTGKVWKRHELLSIIKLCETYGVWVISDEIHCDLSRSGIKHIPAQSVLPGYEKIITCMSTSKTFNLAGNLLANIIIPDAKVRLAWQQLYKDLISPLSIVANKAAWSLCDDWLVQVRRYIDLNFLFLKRYLKKNHPEINFSIPDGTYLAWLNVAPAVSDAATDLPLFFAQRGGVLVEGSKQFVSNSDGYVRLNLACPIAMLEEGLRRFTLALSLKS